MAIITRIKKELENIDNNMKYYQQFPINYHERNSLSFQKLMGTEHEMII